MFATHRTVLRVGDFGEEKDRVKSLNSADLW